jgi:hypothetical protein
MIRKVKQSYQHQFESLNYHFVVVVEVDADYDDFAAENIDFVDVFVELIFDLMLELVNRSQFVADLKYRNESL